MTKRFPAVPSVLVLVVLLACLFLSSLAVAQATGDTRWPGLNPAVTEPTFPSLCTKSVGSNGEPAGVLYANQVANSLTNTADTRLASALTTCKPTAGSPAVGLELKSNGSNNAFVVAPFTLPVGLTLIVDADVIVFAYEQSATTALITPAANTGSSVVAYNGGTMGYWGIMGYGIIDGRGSYWGWSGSGPRLIQLGSGSSSSADYFTLYKITLQNAGMMHVIGLSNYFLAYDVKVSTAADSANTDGIDPSASRNVTIYNSWISDGDDHISPKAGTSPGPLQNVTIANNHLFAGHGISVGSETNTNANNMLVYNNVIDNNGAYGSSSKNSLRIKSDSSRGGEVYNVLFDSICIKNGGHVLIFDPYYSSSTGTKYPNFHDITLHNIHVMNHDASGHNGYSTLQGFTYPNTSPTTTHILTMTMNNVVFDGYTSANFQSEFPATATPSAGSNSGLRYATITLGPDPISSLMLDELNTYVNGKNNVTITNNITTSNTAYDCTGKFVYAAGEFFPSATTINPGDSLTLTTIVQPIPAHTWSTTNGTYTPPTPSGTLTVYDNGTQVASQTVTAPTVTYTCYNVSYLCSSVRSLTKITLPSVATGTHNYTVTYTGDSNYTGVTFPSVTVQAGGTTSSTTTVTHSPTSPVYGQAVTVTATVASGSGSGTPTGTVNFTMDGTAVGSAVTLSSGVATYTASGLSYGTHTAAASYSGDTTFVASSGSDAAISVGKATPTLSLTCTEVPYDGAAKSCTGSATGVNSEVVSGTWSYSSTPANAGTYTITGTFTSTNSNYAGGTATGTLIIDKVAPTLVLTCPEVPYDGNAHGCTTTATGIGAVAVSGNWSVAPGSEINAGSYAETGTFTSSDTNYANGTASATLIIDKAAPALALTCTEVAYDGTAHSCTGAATGVNSTAVNGSWSFNPSSQPNAGSYAVTGTFTSSDTNYANGTASGTLKIDAIAPTLTLTCPTATFDGAAKSCTGAATGVGGATVTGTWNISPASQTNVGSYSVTGTFTSSNSNYTSGGTASGTLTINTANPTLALTCTEAVYDNTTHKCTGAATGVGGATVTGTWSFTPDSESNAGTYAVTGTFTSSNSNYAGGTASGTLKIDVANPTLALTCPDITYDGNGHSCTGTATGIGGVTVGGSWSFNPASVTNAGSTTVTGTFTSSDSNYAGGTATGTLKIEGVAPTLTLTCPTVPYDGAQHVCTGAATGLGGAAVSGTWSYNPAGAVNTGTVTIVATFTSTDGRYTSGTVSNTLTIDKANQSPSVSCPGPLTYDGAAHACQITGGIGTCTSPSVSGVPGSNSLALSCPGDNNHNAWSATGVIAINPATPALSMTCGSFAYDGYPKSCNATATGVAGVTVAGSFSYSPAQSETAAGTYSITATFTSTDANYAGGGQVPGTLIIDGVAPISCPPLPTPVVYGAAAIPFACTSAAGAPLTYTVTNASLLSGNLTFTKAAIVTVKVSQKALTGKWQAYSVTQTVTVTPMPVTIPVDSKIWTYGLPKPVLTINNGQPLTMAHADKQPSLAYSIVDAGGIPMTSLSPLGQYTIKVTPRVSYPNYIFTPNYGILTYQANDAGLTRVPASESVPVIFHDTLAGSQQPAVKTITVKNKTGIDGLVFTPTVTSSGTSVADFTVKEPNCTALRGKACVFTITFYPQTGNLGQLSETLNLAVVDPNAANDPNSSSLPSNLAFTLQGNSLGSFSITAPQFPDTANATVGQQTMTVTNNTSFLMSVTSISSNSSFIVVVKDATNACLAFPAGTVAPMIPAGGKCQFPMLFKPIAGKSTNGTYSGTLTVKAVATGLTRNALAIQTAPLAGNDTQWVSYTPAASATLTMTGTLGSAKTVIVVKNNTDSALTLAAPVFTNISATPSTVTAPFSATTNCSNIAPALSCSVTVKATLPKGGKSSATGTMTFTDPYSNATVTYTLSATD